MKKIVILTIALALVVGMPLLASDFKFGGDLDWGFGLGVGTDNTNQFTRADYNATFDAKAVVDDLTAITLSIKHERGTDTNVATRLEKAQIASNIGNALKLPVGVTFYAGYFSFGNEEYGDITGYDLTDIGNSTGARWQAATAINLMDLVTLEAATSFNWADNPSDYWLGAHGVFGPVSAEVWYKNIGAASAQLLGLDALVDLAVMEGASLKLTAGWQTAPNAGTWDFVAGFKFDYSMFGVGFDFDGNQDNFFNRAGIELSVAPLANVGFNVGAFLTPNAADTLNNIDASVYYKAGAATWRVGYLYAPDGVAADVTWNAVKPATGSGVFIKAGLDY